ncbi:MAG TPA: ABC transporter permease [Candidatus Methylomirabilis sp.]|nr:ABC transporter permease [Candidatus Methylomirabilis sp.]
MRAEKASTDTARDQAPWAQTLRLLGRRRIVVVGLALVATAFLVALLAPLLTRHNPLDLDIAARLRPPSRLNLFGTDGFGRDVFSRVVYGARLSILVGAMSVSVAAIGGGIVGLLAGFYPKLDGVLMRVMDGIMAFPNIVLAIALMASLGPSVLNVIVSLGFVYMPRVARVVRSGVLVVRESLHVEAARALGAGDARILRRNILPNCLSPIIVQATFVFAYAVLGEAALSFLGVGVPPYIASWGNILSEGRQFITQAPWITMFPGAAIMLTVLGLNVVGDGLRDALDPRMRYIYGRLSRKS